MENVVSGEKHDVIPGRAAPRKIKRSLTVSGGKEAGPGDGPGGRRPAGGFGKPPADLRKRPPLTAIRLPFHRGDAAGGDPAATAAAR
jgi:hypothetical protein